MTFDEFQEKLFRKIRYTWVTKLEHKPIYKYCYPSYYHCLMHNAQENGDTSTIYFAAKPNPGAGIGHQLANWIAGYWFAQYFGLKFAHMPFSSEQWEHFLGFYQDEVTVKELKQQGYRVVRIQKFDEYNEADLDRIRFIIRSYSGRKVILLCEQDQFYHDQYGVRDAIQQKFYSCPARNESQLIYNKNHYNVAIHVRRGDIMDPATFNDPEMTKRYQPTSYFVNALKTALADIKDEREVHIYLFSEGTEADFPEFKEFDNLHFCLDMSARASFEHMVYADVLITSKSSFSYKPALLNRGIKYSPRKFWHGYPEEDTWILLDEEGNKI